MRSLVTRLAIAAMALFTSAASMHSAQAGEASGDTIAPLVDRQTLLVAHVDLMAFDAMETVDWMAELLDVPDAERDRLQAQVVPIKVVTHALPPDSSVDIYVVSSLADFGRLPFFFALPTEGHTPAAAISSEARRELEKSLKRPLQTERVGKLLVTGSPETIEGLQKNEPAERPEVAAALQAAGPGAVQFVLVPSAELRKLIETLVPQLPASLGGGSTKTFTQGVTWVATSLDLPPKDVAIRVVVQSPDATTAMALERELTKLVEAIGQLPPVQKALPDFDALSKKLLPAASGDQLKLDLNDANGGIAALTSIAGPVMRAIAAGVTRK
jgi:hypothetical protein